MIIGEILAWFGVGLLMKRSLERHEARMAEEKAAARGQLAADLQVLAAGGALDLVAVPPRPRAPSEHRYFFAVLAGVIGFVGTILAIYGVSNWLGSLETGILGGLVVIVILIVFVIIIVPLAFIVAVAAWGLMMLRAYRRENAFQLADFRHRFLDEREWLRAKLASGDMGVAEAIAILQGEDSPLDLAQSATKGSALTAAARYTEEMAQ